MNLYYYARGIRATWRKELAIFMLSYRYRVMSSFCVVLSEILQSCNIVEFLGHSLLSVGQCIAWSTILVLCSVVC